MNIHTSIRLSLLATLLIAVASCGVDPRDPGRVFIPDMQYSQAYETYTKNPAFEKDSLAGVDSLEARVPVNGTIPRGILPEDAGESDNAVLASYRYKSYFPNDSATYADAGAILKNPFEPTKEVLERGKHLYNIHCMVCHGDKGLGDGSIVKTEAYPPVPSYADRLPIINEGQMFHSITYGKGLMGSYSYALSAEDRWKVICYIESLVGVGPFKKEASGSAAAPADGTATAQ